nr:hypothetical protein [Tanacetum cinerariifolium]GFB95223.1 hypothetical protein [Tanacetum cinerariifolium]
MVNMVPHEAFPCSCAEGVVDLRKSNKPEGCDPTSSIDEFSWSSICWTFNTSNLFFKKCRVLKLQALAWKDNWTKATMNIHMHPEQHTVNSAALLHEVLNEMEKLDFE